MAETTKTEPTTAKVKTSTQIEMNAIRRIQSALEEMTPTARARVLNFVWGSVTEAIQAEQSAKMTVGPAPSAFAGRNHA